MSVTQGALTVTAELHDEDLTSADTWIEVGRRRGVSTEGLTDPPIHLGRRFFITVEVIAGPETVSGITPRGGDCDTPPLSLAPGETASFQCYPSRPAQTGAAVARLELDSSAGFVEIAIPFSVIDPPQLELTVTGPVEVGSGQPIVVTGVLHNPSRVVLVQPLVHPGLCEGQWLHAGAGEDPVILPGESIPWSCDGGVAGLPGTYGPIPGRALAENGDIEAQAAFTYTVTEVMSPSAEWQDLCDLMYQKAQAGIALTDAFEKMVACNNGLRPGDPQCWDAPEGERYIHLWQQRDPEHTRYATLVLEKLQEIDLSPQQRRAFDCWCQPQIVNVLEVLENGDLVIGVDPNAVETYCADGLPFGTEDSVPDG